MKVCDDFEIDNVHEFDQGLYSQARNSRRKRFEWPISGEEGSGFIFVY